MNEHNELDNYSGPENFETNLYLRTRHGDGYLGFQTYRLVHSAYVLTRSAGEWCDWDQNLKPEYRGRIVAGETGKELVAESKADRHVVEMRECIEYPELNDTPGWILQRWMAPAYWGSPTEWNSRTAPGTKLPALGPYPARGKYMLIAGPYDQMPSGPFLDRIVEQWEMMRDDVLALSTASYVRKRTFEAEEREKMRSEKWNRDASAANLTAMQPMLSTFLEGGRARQLAAEHAGINSNYGN